MHPELFKIGGLTIYTHGVLAVLGIVFSSYLLSVLAKKEKLDTTVLFDNIVYAVLVGIIGARLTYFILYRDQFTSFAEIFYLWQGGMVSYGGFIPGFIAFVSLLKMQKADVASWLKISAIAFPAGLFWGRIGNLFAGEYFGISTASRLSLAGQIPVTLYEAILLVVITLSLYLFYLKGSQKIGRYLFCLLGLSYTAGRFIIDFWRDENRILLNTFSIGQLTSLFLFIFFAILTTKLLLQERRSYQTIR